MSRHQSDPGVDDDYITEDPMTLREMEHALAPYLTRKERTRFLKAVKAAGLIMFHE